MELGYRESTASWADVRRDLRDRGLTAPMLAVGDAALGLWAALGEVFPETRHQSQRRRGTGVGSLMQETLRRYSRGRDESARLSVPTLWISHWTSHWAGARPKPKGDKGIASRSDRKAWRRSREALRDARNSAGTSWIRECTMALVKLHLAVLASVLSLLAGAPMTATMAASTTSTAVNPCAADETWLRPSSVEVRSDGGTIDDYWVDGVLTQIPQPPASFDPLNASDADLATYGFPARPPTAADLSAWTADMASWQPTPDVGLCATHGLRATIYNNDIWSGFDADSSSSTTYIAVQGDYHQPAKGSTSCSSPQEVSWVGLGGYHYPKLIQDGTGIDTTGHYYAWYEYLSATGGINITKMPSVTVHAGDRIHDYVVHQTAGLGQTTFYVADNTTSTSQSVIINLGSAYYDGSSAEMIDERPTINGVPATLTNFGVVNWTNANVQKSNATWYNLGTQTTVEFDMWNSAFTHYLAFPYSLSSSTTFQDNWFNCS